MKLQYILTTLMVSLVLGGCQGTSDTRQELERDMYFRCMVDADNVIFDNEANPINPTEWAAMAKVCRVLAQDTFKGYAKQEGD